MFQSITSQMESYINERTGGQVDQTALQQQYTLQLEDKLKERDALWEKKLEQLRLSLSTVQSKL